MTDVVELRRGSYHDSVSLLQASRAVASVAGVEAALVAMATELNLELLDGMGFAAPVDAGANDLMVAIRASDDAALAGAREQLGRSLDEISRPPAGRATADFRPRTIGAAAPRAGAGRTGRIALVSVPGRHAFVEAMDALEAGLSVMVFSDNVPVEQEVLLKDEAARRGLLVMGPDCGTAWIGGVGLGFANVVRPGPVGIVAASGTGAQQLMCLLDAGGTGVSAVLGVGGRDLSARVGGRSTLQALAALDADPATELIVVVSKPPAPEVAEAVRESVRRLSTPVLFALLGLGREDLSTTAEKVVAAVGGAVGGASAGWPELPAPVPSRPRKGALRGLFAGGTLCDEAMALAADRLGTIRSNIPLRPDWALPDDLRAPGHLMVDFGEDRLTVGRPHPMIDPTLRLERLAEEAGDSGTAVVLLDVVLGYGADPDPAAALGPAIGAARSRAQGDGRDLAVVVSLCGTPADPQGFDRQAGALQRAGAAVFLSNAAAARCAAGLVQNGAET